MVKRTHVLSEARRGTGAFDDWTTFAEARIRVWNDNDQSFLAPGLQPCLELEPENLLRV